MKSFEAWHTRGSNACGKLAWTFVRHPRELRFAATSSNVVMPDGSHPKPLSDIACGSCGGRVSGLPTSLSLAEVSSIT